MMEFIKREDAVTGEIVDYIEDYLVRHKMSSVQELIGALEI